MDSAGFTKGSDGIYVDKSGKKLSFTIDVVTGWTDWVPDCQIIATDLKAIGSDATVNALFFNAYFSALQMGNYDMAVSWTNPGPTPSYLYNSLLNSQTTAAIGQTASSNFERCSDSTTDQLLSQYATPAYPSVQNQPIHGLQKHLVDPLP